MLIYNCHHPQRTHGSHVKMLSLNDKNWRIWISAPIWDRWFWTRAQAGEGRRFRPASSIRKTSRPRELGVAQPVMLGWTLWWRRKPADALMVPRNFSVFLWFQYLFHGFLSVMLLRVLSLLGTVYDQYVYVGEVQAETAQIGVVLC